MLLLRLELVSVCYKGQVRSYISPLLLLLRLRGLSVLRWAAECEPLGTSLMNILRFEYTFFFSVVVAIVEKLQMICAEQFSWRERR
jgi:hypothetical protein